MRKVEAEERLKSVQSVIATLQAKARKYKEGTPERKQIADKLHWAERIRRLLLAELDQGPKPTHVETFKCGGVTITAPAWIASKALDDKAADQWRMFT